MVIFWVVKLEVALRASLHAYHGAIPFSEAGGGQNISGFFRSGGGLMIYHDNGRNMAKCAVYQISGGTTVEIIFDDDHRVGFVIYQRTQTRIDRISL